MESRRVGDAAGNPPAALVSSAVDGCAAWPGYQHPGLR